MRRWRWIAVLALAALAAPVAAQEPSVGVAVRVANLHPSVSVGSVTCALFADPDGPQNSVALFLIFKEGDRTLTAAASRISDPTRTEYRAPFRRAPGSPFLGEISGPFGR